MENIQQEVIQILIEESILSPDYIHGEQGTDLLMNDLIDSLNIITLITAFEDKYGIELGTDDIKEENWANVNSIISLVSRHINNNKNNEK
jgi:acyl carrier protein|tara:strand:+ start:230 stop:499 length:270 start_codon:yes stop_codon:yes gene_type:complete